MGVTAVVGWIWISLRTGTSSGTEVPISIISGLSGVLTGKNIVENKLKQLKQEATRAENNPYDNLTDEQKREVDQMIAKILANGKVD